MWQQYTMTLLCKANAAKSNVLAISLWFFLVFFAQAALAETVAWNSAVSGNWSDGTKWSGGVAPTMGDDVVIDLDDTYTVTLDTDATVNSLTMSGTQTLTISNKTLNLNNASTLTTLSITGGTLNNSGVLNIGALIVSLGYRKEATLGGPGAINLTGMSNYFSSASNPGCYGCETVQSTLTIDGGKVLTNTLTGNFIESSEFANFGTGEVVALANGSSIVNQGTWTLGNGNVSLGAGTAAPTGFINTGTLQTGLTTTSWNGNFGSGGTVSVSLVNSGMVSVPVGTLTLAGAGTNSHSGTFNVLSGATLNFSAGNHTLSNVAAITGSGTVNFSGTGTSSITGSVTAASLSSSGTTTFSGITTVGSVTQNGSGALTFSDTTATGVTSVTVNGGTLSFASSLNALSSVTMNGGTLALNTAATTLNSITTNGGTLNVSVPVSALSTITQTGGTTNLNDTATTNLTTLNLSGGTLNNAGVMNIRSFTTSLGNDGSATLGGAGAINLTGTSNFTTSSYNPGCYGCETVQSTLTIDGGKVLTNTLTGNFIEASVYANFGTGEAVSLVNGSSIVNHGTWTMGNGKVTLGAGTAATTGFKNTGTLQTGLTTTSWNSDFGSGGAVSVSMVNSGTLNVPVGTLIVNPTTFTQSGTINVASGATFSCSTGFTSSGTLSGSGTMIVGTGAAKLVNQGSINPGSTSTAGTLTISGDLQLSTNSNLIMDIGGTSPGQFDSLAVSGAVTLDGMLTVNPINTYTANYIPALDDRFKISTFSTKKYGTFKSSAAQSIAGKKWGIAYNPSDVTLLVAAGNGETTAANFQTIGAITFSPATLSVGGTTTVSAKATSDLAVSFSSITPDNCTVVGNTVSAIKAGACTIAADQTGNSSFFAADRVTRDISTSSTRNTVTWNGAVSGNWSDGSKWSGGVAPTVSDDVVVAMAGTFTITLDNNATVNSLNMGGSSGTQTLATGGKTLNLNAAGSFNTNSVIDLSGGMLNLSGVATLAGTVKNGTVTSTATLTSNNGTLDGITVGSNMAIGGTLHVANGITLANGVTVNTSGTTLGFSGTNKSITTPGTATIISSGGVIYPSEDTDNVTLTIGPGITWSGCPNITRKPVTTYGCWYSTGLFGEPSYGTCTQDYNYNITNDGTFVADSGGACCGLGNLYLTSFGSGTASCIDQTKARDISDNAKSIYRAKGTETNCNGNCNRKIPIKGDPVDLATGFYFDTVKLMEIVAAGSPLRLDLSYSSGNPASGITGYSWGHSFQFTLSSLASSVEVTWPDRHVSYFALNGTGAYVNVAANSADTLVKNLDGSYLFTDRRGKSYTFDTAGQLTGTVDRLGFVRSFSYVGNNLDRVTDAQSGRFLQFGYDSQDRVSSVASADAGTVTLAYDGAGDLASVTDPLGNTTSFTYDANHRLLTKVNALGATIVSNTYDAATGRITSQDDGVSATPLELFSYATDAATGNPYVTYQNRSGATTRYNFDAGLNHLGTVDPLGGTESDDYNPSGERTSQRDSLNIQTQFTYDNSGYILSRINAFGNSASYTYDAEHNILTSTDEAGNVTTMTYGPNHQLLTRTDAKGAVTTYTYNAQGLLTTVTAPTGGVTTYSYDPQGNLAGTVDPAGLTSGYSYDSAGRMLTRTDGGGKVWTMTYDLRGQLLTAADPLGNTTAYSYDALGRIATQTAPGGGVTSYTYDIHDNLLSLTNPLGGVTTFDYDADDQLISTTDPLGHTTTLTRDAKGRVIATTDPLGHVTAQDYNAADAVTAITDPLNNPTGLAYDSLHRLTTVTDPLSKSTVLAYDAVSKVTSQTDAKESSTSFGYDALGQLVSSTNALGGTVAQVFDQNGNRASFTDANGNVTTYTLDVANRINRIATADGGATSFTYNDRNLVATATNGRGQLATYSYDNAGKLVTLVDPTGTTTYGYDANANLVSVGDARGTASYTYDALNRLTGTTDLFGQSIGYGYDAVGNLTTLTYPGNKVVTYTFDAAGRMTSVSDWSGHLTAYSYDAAGRPTQIDRANGTKAVYTYDAKGQVTSSSETTTANASLYTIAITYDDNGNITSEVTTPRSSTPAASVASLTYGADNRLSTANGQPVVHDADGNMTSGPLAGVNTTYSFDARSHLTGVGSSSYLYDAQGNRVAATHTGVTTRVVVDPNAPLPRVLMETDASGTPTTYYVYGLGLISREDATTYQAYHYDLRGSTLKLTDASGAVTDSYSYGPYGELVATTGETVNPFRYNGRDGVMTEPNGLYYMRARYYLPETRRFISRDVLLGSVEEALTLNRFAYVSGNPLGFVDPSGMKFNESQWGVITATAGALIIDAAAATTATTIMPAAVASIGVGLVARGLLQIAVDQGWHPGQAYIDQIDKAAVEIGNFIINQGHTADMPQSRFTPQPSSIQVNDICPPDRSTQGQSPKPKINESKGAAPKPPGGGNSTPYWPNPFYTPPGSAAMAIRG